MDVVADICELPLRLRIRNISVIALVEESGYRDDPNALTVDAISSYLAEHPELVDSWFGYSEDKRTSSGWYVKQLAADAFEIGYYPKGEPLSISGRIPACAEFIVRESRDRQ